MNNTRPLEVNSGYQSVYRAAPPPAPEEGADRLDIGKRAGGRMVAVARACRLAWDTAQLGIPCGRIEQLWASGREYAPALMEALDEVLEIFAREKTQFVDARVGLHDLSLAQALERRGFYLADVMAIYGSAAPPLPSPAPGGYSIGAGRPGGDALQDAERFTLSAFSHSRLYQDEHISRDKADAFYLALLRHFFTKPDTTLILANGPEGRVVGYALGRLDPDAGKTGEPLAYLWMIAVDPAHEGKGLGAALLNEFLRRMHQRAPFVEVGTQVSNAAANRLYRKANLAPVTHLATFHRWSAQ